MKLASADPIDQFGEAGLFVVNLTVCMRIITGRSHPRGIRATIHPYCRRHPLSLRLPERNQWGGDRAAR